MDDHGGPAVAFDHRGWIAQSVVILGGRPQYLEPVENMASKVFASSLSGGSALGQIYSVMNSNEQLGEPIHSHSARLLSGADPGHTRCGNSALSRTRKGVWARKQEP